MAEQLFQVSLKAVIRNQKGEVLLQAEPKADGYIEIWDMPGGRMDPGETFLEALQRELREEIAGEYVGEPKFIMHMLSPLTIPVDDDRVGLVILAYEVTLADDFTPISNEEGSIIVWEQPAKAAELLRVKFTPEFCDYIAKL